MKERDCPYCENTAEPQEELNGEYDRWFCDNGCGSLYLKR